MCKFTKKGGEKMKKVLAIMLSMLILLPYLVINSSAYDSIVEEKYEVADVNSAQKSSILIIDNNNKATCKSVFSDIDNNIYSIKVIQTLEKHWAFGIFLSVDDANWEKTVYSDCVSFTNYKFSLGNGTYRLKTVFTVTMRNGQTETITVYSSEESI